MSSFSIWHWIVILVMIFVYLIPTVIAIRKSHPHKVAITLTNILGGLVFGVGWLVALVWCFIQPKVASGAQSS
jgi:hypothetical protein